MRQYILKRVLLVIPTVVCVTIIVFTMVRLLPGDIATLMASENSYASDVEGIKKLLGLDKPIHEQYVIWLSNAAKGDLGESLWTRRPVMQELMMRVPVSLELGVFAMIISLLIAIPIGVVSAIRQDKAVDYIFRSFAIASLAVPGFWLATLVLVFPSIWFHWVPPMRYRPLDLSDPMRNIGQFIIPAIIMGLALAASVMRMTRSMMLEVLRQDYVRTAWAKGLRERGIIFRHAMKNAMIPVITILGLQAAQLVSGTVVMENIFALPGMGRFLLEAIAWRDYPVIQGINLFLASFIILINLLVDVTYGYLDPRIRYR